MLLRVMIMMRLMEQLGVTVAAMRATHPRGSGEVRGERTSGGACVLVRVEVGLWWLDRTRMWQGALVTP